MSPLEQPKKILIDLDLSRRILSQNPRIKLEAERELKLSQNICRTPKLLFRRTKFTDQSQTIYLERGQYFSTYRLLGELWQCSIKAARYQLEKWASIQLIQTKVVKDARGFDFGLVINYNPVFLNRNRGIRKSKQTKALNGLVNRVGASISEKNLKRKTTDGKVAFSLDINFGKRVYGKLVLLGFSNFEIEKIYLKYSVEEILDYHRLVKLSNKVTNPKAWLKSALKAKYSLQLVNDSRSAQKFARMEIQKAREEVKEHARMKIESEKIQMAKLQAEKIKQQQIEKWMSDALNQEKYTKQVLAIIAEIESSKNIKPTIEAIQNREFTSHQYRNFRVALDREIEALTGKAMEKLDQEYFELFSELSKLDDENLFSQKVAQLTREKELKIIEIKSLPEELEMKLKTQIVEQNPSLNWRLEKWLDEQIELPTVHQTITTDPSVSNHFNSQFVGDRKIRPEGLCTPRIGCFTSK